MKKIIVILLSIFVFCSCSGEKSSFSMGSVDQTAVITAENADTDSKADTTFSIYDGEQVHIVSDVQAGVIVIRYYDGEQTEGDDFAAEIKLEGNEDYYVTLPEGEYTLVAGVEEKATGKVELTIELAPEEGTAGSNIPIKDNADEAKYQIEVAMQYLLEETYGDKVNDGRIYVEKIYTAEDEAEVPVLKDMNLSPDEVAFEVRYELHPAEGVDVNELLVANGEFDKESGWVIDKYGVGILRPNPNGNEPAYVITDFGTGF